jgi:hypothetical protein
LPSQATVQLKPCDMTIDPYLESSSTRKSLTRRKAWTCSRTSYISSRSISELSSVAGERLFEERHLSKLDTVDISPEWRCNGPFRRTPFVVVATFDSLTQADCGNRVSCSVPFLRIRTKESAPRDNACPRFFSAGEGDWRGLNLGWDSNFFWYESRPVHQISRPNHFRVGTSTSSSPLACFVSFRPRGGPYR